MIPPRSNLRIVVVFLVLTVLLSSCATYYQFEQYVTVGKFEHRTIPDAIYVHQHDDFVIGTDIRLVGHELHVTGSSALAKFSTDYNLEEVVTLHKRKNGSRHRWWYTVNEGESTYAVGFRWNWGAHRDWDHKYFVARSLDRSDEDVEFEVPYAIKGPLVVDFDGDGNDSVVLLHAKSRYQVVLYKRLRAQPEIIELPAFWVPYTQAVDIDCNGTTELFLELLPLTEDDDKYALSVIAGPDTNLYPLTDYWQRMVGASESACARQPVRTLASPRFIATDGETFQLVEWNEGESAIKIKDQFRHTLEHWELSRANGFGYISGWHEYRSCDETNVEIDCELRRFAVVSQSLDSCGIHNDQCGSVLVELFLNGEYEEIWRSPQSTRTSLLFQNGDLLLHSGDSLVVKNIFR